MRSHSRAAPPPPRFAAVPQPTALADVWGFGDLVAAGASRILFTNGMNDGET